jgi:PhnB protein
MKQGVNTMTKPIVKAIPDGVRTLTPELICAGAAEAIAFYKKAFGADEVMRFAGPDGKLVHAEIKIGDSKLRLMDEMAGALGPKSLKGSPVTINMQVNDVDAVVKKAVGAGAKITMPLADQFWGDRYAKLDDPFGHHWSVASHIRDVSPKEMQEAMSKMGE